MPSWVYRNSYLYELLMMGLYGRHYFARLRLVAGRIPAGSSVLDLCCGPGTIYHHYLRHKAVRYTGLDVNPRFIASVQRAGGQAQAWNLHQDDPLPAADHVIMLGGLLHFLPDPRPVVDRMLRAAQKQVIICDPVRNLATSKIGPLRWIAQRSTDPGTGPVPQRFTEETLDAFFAGYGAQVAQAFLIPGGRDKVYVLNKEAARQAARQAAPSPVLGAAG
jgi:SAM-dependent methyltransferase